MDAHARIHSSSLGPVIDVATPAKGKLQAFYGLVYAGQRDPTLPCQQLAALSARRPGRHLFMRARYRLRGDHALPHQNVAVRSGLGAGAHLVPLHLVDQFNPRRAAADRRCYSIRAPAATATGRRAAAQDRRARPGGSARGAAVGCHRPGQRAARTRLLIR